MKQLIIILIGLAIALIIVVGCKSEKNKVDVVSATESVDSLPPQTNEEWIYGYHDFSEGDLSSTTRINPCGVNPWGDTVKPNLPFLNVLKDTTFKLSRMKTFEFFIGDAGDMVARKHLNGEWEVLDCGRALNVILKMNKDAAKEIEKLEEQLDGFRSAYKHDDIRPMVGVDRLQPGKEGVVRAVVKGTLGWVYTFETIN